MSEQDDPPSRMGSPYSPDSLRIPRVWALPAIGVERTLVGHLIGDMDARIRRGRSLAHARDSQAPDPSKRRSLAGARSNRRTPRIP
jgi:hypothetical protein